MLFLTECFPVQKVFIAAAFSTFVGMVAVFVSTAAVVYARTLADIGTSGPAPGPDDLQLSSAGDAGKSDNPNYYTDNGVNNPAVGEPRQTFTIGPTRQNVAQFYRIKAGPPLP